MSDKQKEIISERLVATFSKLKDADGLRSKLIFNIKPPPFIYVITYDRENGPWDVMIANEFGGTRPYQVEFNQIDQLVSGTGGISYQLASLDDESRFVLSIEEEKYVLHKFDFKVEESEFASGPTSVALESGLPPVVESVITPSSS